MVCWLSADQTGTSAAALSFVDVAFDDGCIVVVGKVAGDSGDDVEHEVTAVTGRVCFFASMAKRYAVLWSLGRTPPFASRTFLRTSQSLI